MAPKNPNGKCHQFNASMLMIPKGQMAKVLKRNYSFPRSSSLAIKNFSGGFYLSLAKLKSASRGNWSTNTTSNTNFSNIPKPLPSSHFYWQKRYHYQFSSPLFPQCVTQLHLGTNIIDRGSSPTSPPTPRAFLTFLAFSPFQAVLGHFFLLL